MWNILVLPFFLQWFGIMMNYVKGFAGMFNLFDLRFPRFSDMSRLHLSNLLDASMFMISACIP